MDVIKAIEDYLYYHSMTGQSREEWEAWRVQACDEWMLDKRILGKEGEGNGSSESKPDHSSNDSILHESAGDCGGSRRIRQYRLSDAARVFGEDGPVRPCVQGSGDIPGGCHRL